MKGLILTLTNILCMLHGTVGNMNLRLFLSENNLVSSYNPSYNPSLYSNNVNSIINLDSLVSNSVYNSFSFSHNSEKMSFYRSSVSFNEISNIKSQTYHSVSYDYESYDYDSNNLSELSFSFNSFIESNKISHDNIDDDTNHDDTNHDDTNHDDTNHDDTNHDDTNHDDTNHDDIENYDKFVKVDLDIVGESKATFDILKQQIFINGVSIIISVNSKLIWFDSINDIIYQGKIQNRFVRKLDTSSVNAILGVAVNETTGNNVITSFKNSVDNGSLVSYLTNNGLSISLNINEISLVTSPELSNDDFTDPSLPNPTRPNSDNNSVNKKDAIIIVCSIGGFLFIIFGTFFINKIRNRIKPLDKDIPFKAVSIDNSFNRYMPYYKKHSPNIINVINDKQ